MKGIFCIEMADGSVLLSLELLYLLLLASALGACFSHAAASEFFLDLFEFPITICQQNTYYAELIIQQAASTWLLLTGFPCFNLFPSAEPLIRDQWAGQLVYMSVWQQKLLHL